MLQERWVVTLPSPEALRRIPEEQVVAGTRIDGEDGGTWLMYRDRFSALKAAHYAGSQARRARVASDDGQPRAGAVRLGNGELLLLAPVADRPAPRSGPAPRPAWAGNEARPYGGSAA